MLIRLALSTLITLAPAAAAPPPGQNAPGAVTPSRPNQSRPSPSDEEREAAAALFADGRRHYARGSYGEALDAFAGLADSYPGGDLADLATLWSGRCHLKLGNTVRARLAVIKLRKMRSAEFADLLHAEIMREVLAELERRRSGGGPR